MDKRKITRGSKKLSWLLRFGAAEAGVSMDPAGWVPLDEVKQFTGLDGNMIEQIVARNNKTRFQLQGRKIRACQGHGSGLPVRPGALEATWAVLPEAQQLVFHGTHAAAVEGIATEGILPGDRTHVHLAVAPDSRVGKRASVTVLLEVSVPLLRRRGREVFVSPNGVVLTRDVPLDCIVGLRALSRKAVKQADRLRELLGLSQPARADRDGEGES